MDKFESLIYSPLEADVHPWEWIHAMLIEYRNLRDKATAAGIENDDPDSEFEMLHNVEIFCKKAQKLNMLDPLNFD